MALENAPQAPLGRIDPASITARAGEVVTPSAVDALSDAVRKGFITADDITSRIQAQPVRAAQGQLAKESISPEAIALRKKTTEAQSAQLTYGHNLEAFTALSPEAGIAQPMTADGNPDYAKMAELGGKLLAWKSQQAIAKSHLTTHGTPLVRYNQDGSTSPVFVNQFGEEINDNLHQKYAKDLSPFSDLQGGQATQPTQPAQSATPPPLTYSGGLQPSTQFTAPAATQEEAIARNAKLNPAQVISKTAAATAAKPVIEPTTTPVGIDLGKKPEASGAQQKVAADTAESLAINNQLKTNVEEAKKLITQANVVGPGAGSEPVIFLNRVGAAFGAREKEYNSQQRLLQLINKKVLEGARAMKGNLSDKDVRFLQQSFPSLASSEPVWSDYLTQWGKMLDLNDRVMRGISPKGASIFDAANVNSPVSGAPTAAATTPGQSGPVVPLSSGKKLQRDANGVYSYVP